MTQPSKIRAVCIDPARIESFWLRVSPFIEAAYKRQPCLDTFDAVKIKIFKGDALVWVAFDEEILGVAVTELWGTPRGKVCAILACGGKQMRRWIHLIKDIEQFARNEGCVLIHLQGRKAWARVLPNYKQRIILEKKL